MKINTTGFTLSSIIVSILLFLPADLIAQSFTSPIGWHHNDYDNRTGALGQTTSALSNMNGHSLNPAAPLPEQGIFYFNSPMFFTSPYEQDVSDFSTRLFNPSLAYSISNFTFRATLDRSKFARQDLTAAGFQEIEQRSSMARVNVGYAFSGRFSVGAGFTYASYAFKIRPELQQQDREGNAWGLNLGIHYREQFSIGGVRVSPQAGLSFNDLSSGFDFDPLEWPAAMPGQIRLAYGFDIKSASSWLERPLFSFGVYSSFAKYLARSDIDPETDEVTFPSGFEAIFTGWKPVTRFDGVNYATIPVRDQISTGIGLEAGLAETLFFRFGRFGGAEFWTESSTSAGIELDLYYLSFGVNRIWFDDTDQFAETLNTTTNFSFTARIPLDGQHRNTVIGWLLDL
ncbi:MAG: hypothetical protein LAT84_08930 [Balneolia bacterium]|nr:hypothetical protein [Balneolia bacterium]